MRNISETFLHSHLSCRGWPGSHLLLQGWGGWPGWCSTPRPDSSCWCRPCPGLWVPPRAGMCPEIVGWVGPRGAGRLLLQTRTVQR